ncbi:MAG: repeat protein [Ignavibacteriaceae bacterium]|nr:repeat protein [Ignavibacteriaceae bacterium]
MKPALYNSERLKFQQSIREIMKHCLFIFFIVTVTINAQSPEWISFFQGPGNVPETIEKVTFDNSGNIYLSGYGYLTSGGGGTDFFTVKCNSNGAEEWSKVYNGPQNDTDRPYGIFVDDNGNVYVTGTSRWNSSAYKIVTLKYSQAGDLLWICAFDSLGQSDGEPKDIWVDNNGNIYVTGWISQTNNGYYDVVTIKMNEDGNILDWSYFGQVNNVSDYGYKIISDNNENVLTGGSSYRNVSLGIEVVIIKYNNNLDTSWVVHINGSDNSFNEFIVDIALDDTGNVYSLCRLQNSPGSTDFAVLKINPNGDVIWRVEYDEAGGQDIPEAMVMDNEGNIYVTGRVRRSGGGGYNDFAVIKYNNSGIEQWKSYYDGPESFDDDPINISIDQNRNVYVCGEINPDGGSHFKFTVVKFNSDGSFDWEYIYDENVSSRAVGVWVDNSGYVFAAGDGEGANGNQDLMAVKLSKISGVEDIGSSVNEFVLFQNYPNPFNPSTVISYQLPVNGNVTLIVYDVLGNEVSTLINEEKPAGNYEVEFSAEGLTSGIYFYKLQAGSVTETKKMILMR